MSLGCIWPHTYFDYCRCDETRNFEATELGSCECKKGFVLNLETETCERPRSRASPATAWVVYLVVFIAVTITVGAIVYLKRKG